MQDPTSRLPEGTAQRVKVDLLAHVETALDHPLEKVWPYILHWNLWVDEKDYVEHHVAGSHDTEGEVKRITHFDETGRMDSSFFVTVIKIEPHKQLVYKILSPSYVYDAVTGASTEVPLTGYEVFDLREEKRDQTIVTLDIFAESCPAGISKDQVHGIAKDYRINTDKNWHGNYFPKLNKLLSNK